MESTVNITRSRKAASLALAGALAVTLAACSDTSEGEETPDVTTDATDEQTEEETADDEASTEAGGSSELPTPIADLGVSGSLNGSGASSQANAQQAWRDNFSADFGVTVNYNPTGSGTGREQFIGGAVSFAGTDSILDEEELAAAAQRCGSDIVELPLYISPIAIAYNVPGVDSLNLSAANVAAIFSGEITNWNDEAIAADNEGVELPDLEIVPVNRADDSGTTENFVQYIIEAAGEEAWPYEAADAWPISGTQSAEKTSGVVDLTTQTEGAITYADASQIGDLPAANVEVNGEFLAYSPEAAAAIVDGSEPTADATDLILTVDLKRDGSIADAYPVVMISYIVACTEYEDAQEAANVKGYLSYMASDEGQQAATAAGGGNAPISDDLQSRVFPAIDAIVTE
ncbi:phosphate ABC transporter substrate-binding protein PstS [Flaviflexus sp. JY899]|uniref:Phosphate-binding protein n=1 Tax=Flaviflexus equikiangi TaxID=2758573 RepID=A0ABS2TIT1_9ACTO|nr:phosphate ABC transporter substrate-binding protein PstS [Flaviflexus equikiangi]MBM9433667.1 phosphate ABC transporter substrate-binding protein PstS [Flaviflexus equikiangi]